MAENVRAVAVTPQPARNPVEKYLEWIGFRTEDNRNSIRDEGALEAFNNFVGLAESDIRDTASGLSKMTATQGHINFGMRHIKYTLGIMH